MNNRLVFAILVITIALSILLAGCSGGVKPVATAGASAISTSAPQRGITGTVSTGQVVEAKSAQINTNGGSIIITDLGSPLQGLELTVPANSFPESRQFEISYALVEKHSFGTIFNPVSPLITIENGVYYSDDLITLKVPVQVPEGHFAMGFYYDKSTGRLEGMPLLAVDAGSVTLATRHFSDFLISSIPETLLTGNVDTGYKPGVDDWQLGNGGSIIVGGQCAGESISSIYYYDEKPDGADAHLFNRYDNDGDPNYKTPDYEKDDCLALKLVTSVQVDYEDKNLLLEKKFRESTKINDEITYKLFRYSMLATGLPQLLVTSYGYGGHALVAYKIVDGALYVADPNSPGKTTVTYEYNKDTAKFESNSICNYMATSALVSWQQVAKRWAELKNGTIGDDRYPAYDIMILGEKGDWTVLKDGYISKQKLISLKIVSKSTNAVLTGPGVVGAVESTRVDSTHKDVELKPGNNRLGLLASGKISTVIDGSSWAGFKYYNIGFNAVTLEPAALNGEINKSYTFTAKTDNIPENSKLVWTLNGSQSQSGKENSFTTKFNTAGDYTIGVQLVGADGKEMASDSAAAVINNAPTTPAENKLQRLQARTKLTGNLYLNGTESWTNFANPKENTTKPNSFRMSYSFDKITWEGTAFTGTLDTGAGWWMTVNGTAAEDGSSITSMKVVLHPDKTRPDYISTWAIDLTKVPLDFTTYKTNVIYQGQGPSVQVYVAKVENYSRTMTGTPATIKSEMKLESVNWADGAVLNFQFN